MVFTSPGPMIATTATASSSEGSASSTSMMRMIGVSSHFGKNAAINPSTMPGISASTTDTKPIQNDSRAPYIRRERMSRPASSVPSTKRQLPPSSQAGGILTLSRYCSIGLCGAISGAKIAMKTRISTIAPATTAPRLREKLAQNSRPAMNRPLGTGISAPGLFWISAMGLPRVANARIQHAVQQVDQIHKNNERRDHQDTALHDGIIAPADGVDEPLTHARPREQRLGQHSAGEQRADLEADHGHHGNERVTQRMHDHHASRRKPFGARGADVILAQHFEHR